MASTATTSARGPVGETRSIGLSILWFILTLGIYGIYWVYKTQEEVKRYSGNGIGGVLGLVIYILLSPVPRSLSAESTASGSCSRSPARSSGSSRCRERSTATGSPREPHPPRLLHGAGGREVAGRARPGMGRARRGAPACHARHAGPLRVSPRPPVPEPLPGAER